MSNDDLIKDAQHELDTYGKLSKTIANELIKALQAQQSKPVDSELVEEMERSGAACVKSLSYRIVPCDVFDKAITALSSQPKLKEAWCVVTGSGSIFEVVGGEKMANRQANAYNNNDDYTGGTYKAVRVWIEQ